VIDEIYAPPQEITDELIAEVVRRIVEVADPDKIILFGSHARGEARSRSDLDILVIKNSDVPRWDRSGGIYHALRDIMVPMDILVYTPEEVYDWSQVKRAFVTTAVREGKVLYEKPA